MWSIVIAEEVHVIFLTKMLGVRRLIASAAKHSWGFHRFGQLQQVVNRADQAPFALRLVKATQHELPEPSSLFDLAEHRLNDRLAQPIPAAPPGPCQLSTHRSYAGTAGAAAAGGARFMMALAPGGDVAIYMMASKDGEVALGAVPGVSRELLRLPSRVLFDLLQGRGELLHIGGVIAQALRHDDLRRGVHRRLGVVGLHILFAGLAHDAALRVGKVALRLRFGRRLTGRARL